MGRSGRQQRGIETRARIVRAASELFERNGYADTTMAAIAAEAGVAVQTLYLSFGSKVAILSAAHDIAVVGDTEPIPVLERPWMVEVTAEPDGRRALARAVDETLAIVARSGRIQETILSASTDPDVGELLTRTNQQRHATLRAITHVLAAKPGFNPTLSVEEAGDIFYALVGDEMYRALVVDCGWTPTRLRDWVQDVAAQQLFPARPAVPAPGARRARRP